MNKYTTNQGWGLTAAYGLVYAAIAVLPSHLLSPNVPNDYNDTRSFSDDYLCKDNRIVYYRP